MFQGLRSSGKKAPSTRAASSNRCFSANEEPRTRKSPGEKQDGEGCFLDLEGGAQDYRSRFRVHRGLVATKQEDHRLLELLLHAQHGGRGRKEEDVALESERSGGRGHRGHAIEGVAKNEESGEPAEATSLHERDPKAEGKERRSDMGHRGAAKGPGPRIPGAPCWAGRGTP